MHFAKCIPVFRYARAVTHTSVIHSVNVGMSAKQMVNVAVRDVVATLDAGLLTHAKDM